MDTKKPLLLIILDGFGYRAQTAYNAIAQAHTPHLNQWLKKYPHTLLNASGASVGLLKGYIGNSQVGHLTIGTGRIIKQAISVIHTAIENGSFFNNQPLTTCLKNITQTRQTLHIMGLLSDAGVHSHITHLLAYIQAAQQYQITKIILHLFLDGRDTPPQACMQYLTHIDQHIKNMPHITIGSLHGRFYAMDRDHNWERTYRSYSLLTEEQLPSERSWHELIQYYYAQGITDEFIPPTLLHAHATIQDEDSVIFFNIRPDRARQLTAAFVIPDFSYFTRKRINIRWFITPINYGITHTTILFPTKPIYHTLKETISNAGKTIFSIAETEKYAHITYFFSGGHEQPFPGETQVLIPSFPKETYKHCPRMSADAITTAVIKALTFNATDFYLINYANADMVGHSGDISATIKAIECLDEQLALLYANVIQEKKGIMLITGDHGKAEDMFDRKTGQPRTAHTTNPVPFLYLSHDTHFSAHVAHMHELAHIAPFILNILNIPIPPEMSKYHD